MGTVQHGEAGMVTHGELRPGALRPRGARYGTAGDDRHVKARCVTKRRSLLRRGRWGEVVISRGLERRGILRQSRRGEDRHCVAWRDWLRRGLADVDGYAWRDEVRHGLAGSVRFGESR